MQGLTVTAAVQLGFGLAGLARAVTRGYTYELPWLHGDPDKVARDAPVRGTAYSAPGPMLVGQAVLTGVLARGPDARAHRGLGLLGAAMVGGYLAERRVRARLRPSGWDALETPLVAGGLALAALMAVLGLSRDPEPARPWPRRPRRAD